MTDKIPQHVLDWITKHRLLGNEANLQQAWEDARSWPAPEQAPVRYLRQTHTYALLELSPEAWTEIHAKLDAAGYHHAFLDDGRIDMHGIAVVLDPSIPSKMPVCGKTIKNWFWFDTTCVMALDHHGSCHDKL